MIEISIIVPARNEEKNIRNCLNGIVSQAINRSYEIILIDSGSTDRTVDIVKTFPNVNVIRVKSEEFGHGKTRNLGAKSAKGKHLVFLNADATPHDNNWLEPLINSLESAEFVAGVFSRHIPHKNCYLFMRRDLSVPMLFSTVSAAIKKEVWMNHPFNDNIEIAEDQEWGRRVVKAGYKIIFEPKSAVLHSHNYNPIELFRIKYRIGRENAKHQGRKAVPSFLFAVGGAIYKIAGDVIYILSQNMPIVEKSKEIGISIFSRIFSFAGRFWGEVAL